ncbi:MAG: hypothetical protein M1609_11305 [Firmicutes bacterium]|nr:hypothetical protein [Bacillota bacterium]
MLASYLPEFSIKNYSFKPAIATLIGTLVKHLIGLLRPQTVQVTVCGQDTAVSHFSIGSVGWIYLKWKQCPTAACRGRRRK